MRMHMANEMLSVPIATGTLGIAGMGLTAVCRAAGIPARLGFADVKNHMSSKRLYEKMRTNIFLYHGFTEIYLEEKWVIVERPQSCASPGFCIRALSKIIIKDTKRTHEQLQVIIIHEICHAMTTAYHGNKWFTRMSKASTKARKMENVSLSQSINKDAKDSTEPELRSQKITNKDVYQKIYNLALTHGISCEDCMHSVAICLGIEDEEFKKLYRRYEYHYKKALIRRHEKLSKRLL